ncbi:kinase [Thraustotheca clavata]|uniref:Kinase n=1 Tax=Thraustotheca clavata TaxID=74557 RepID=A0A1W0ACL0_9STRA|nr:kinase [Thraustotheca clavata]
MPHSHLANAYEFVRTIVETEATLALYLHIASHQLVVIKSFVTNATTIDEITTMDMAYRELVINQELQQHPHENIVRLRDSFVENGHVHLVFDYCNGGDLLSVMSTTSNAWKEGEIVGMFRQIANGLAHIHSLGIAHLDMSLENILVDGKAVRICDFGFGLLNSPSRFGGVGKLYYMSPEMHLRRAYNAQAADRWALGVVLFIMLTGRPIFEEATMHDTNFKLFFQAQAKVPESGVAALMDQLNLKVSFQALDLLTKLLDPSPRTRLSMEDVLAHPFLHPVQPKFTNLRKRSLSQPCMMSSVNLRNFKPLPQLSMSFMHTLSSA